MSAACADTAKHVETTSEFPWLLCHEMQQVQVKQWHNTAKEREGMQAHRGQTSLGTPVERTTDVINTQHTVLKTAAQFWRHARATKIMDASTHHQIIRSKSSQPSRPGVSSNPRCLPNCGMQVHPVHESHKKTAQNGNQSPNQLRQFAPKTLT